MKTIIYLLVALFVIEMLPLNLIKANDYVRIVMEATKKSTTEEVMKQSSDIMSARLNQAGIEKFDINIEPGRIILLLEKNYATDPVKKILVARGRFEFREKDTRNLILEGKDIESIETGLDSYDHPYASILFKNDAAHVWAEATRKNLNKTILVLLDDQVIYNPVVRDMIPNGSCLITGSFTLEELQYFSILGNSGELPAEFRIVK